METTYPSIRGPAFEQLGQPCVAFHKYDGSNLRFLWQEAKGWFRFGTRYKWLKPFPDGAQSAVGGYLQMTSVTPTGIETRVLRHYPDMTGRPIDLNAKLALPVLYRVHERMLAWAFQPQAKFVPSADLWRGYSDAALAAELLSGFDHVDGVTREILAAAFVQGLRDAR